MGGGSAGASVSHSDLTAKLCCPAVCPAAAQPLLAIAASSPARRTRRRRRPGWRRPSSRCCRCCQRSARLAEDAGCRGGRGGKVWGCACGLPAASGGEWQPRLAGLHAAAWAPTRWCPAGWSRRSAACRTAPRGCRPPRLAARSTSPRPSCQPGARAAAQPSGPMQASNTWRWRPSSALGSHSCVALTVMEAVPITKACRAPAQSCGGREKERWAAKGRHGRVGLRQAHRTQSACKHAGRQAGAAASHPQPASQSLRIL